jgi:hypothetical protein
MANFKMGSQTIFTQTNDDRPITGSAFPAGMIIQVVTDSFSDTGAGIATPALASSTTISNTDGHQLFNTSFTPKFANSKLLVQTSTVMATEESNDGDSGYMVAFYDTTRCIVCYGSPLYTQFEGGKNFSFFSFNHTIDSWGTSTKNLNVRAGMWAAGYIVNRSTSGTMPDYPQTVGLSIMEISG